MAAAPDAAAGSTPQIVKAEDLGPGVDPVAQAGQSLGRDAKSQKPSVSASARRGTEKQSLSGSKPRRQGERLKDLRKKLLARVQGDGDLDTIAEKDDKGEEDSEDSDEDPEDKVLEPKEELIAPKRDIPDYGDIIEGDDMDFENDELMAKEQKDEEEAGLTMGAPVFALSAEGNWRRAKICEIKQDDSYVVEWDDLGAIGKVEVTRQQIHQDRPEAIRMGGCERLTRNHIADLLGAMQLPRFRNVEYISDDTLVVVFKSGKHAAQVLRAFREGFHELEDYRAPGPGIWRAQRGYLNFRAARLTDIAGPGFKKIHRGGRQVRAFREWAAGEEETMEQYGDLGIGGWYARDKVRTVHPDDVDMDFNEAEDDNEAGPSSGSILDQMSQQDKSLLGPSTRTKEEPGAFEPAPNVLLNAGVKLEMGAIDAGDWGEGDGDAAYIDASSGTRFHSGRGTYSPQWVDFVRSVKGTMQARGYRTPMWENRKRKRGYDDFENSNGANNGAPREAPTGEERAKRQRRSERFGGMEVGGGSVNLSAEEEAKRKKRLDRFAA